MPIYFVRHCESEANQHFRNRRNHPDSGIPLSAAGMRRRGEVGAALNLRLGEGGHRGKVHIISSDYRRAVQTADGLESALAAGGKQVSRDTDPRLGEMHRGSFYAFADKIKAKKWPALFARYSRLRKGTPAQQYTARAYEGESMEDTAKRVHEFVDDIKKRYSAQDTLVIVSHDVTERLLLQELLGKSPEWAVREPVPGNGSIRLVDGPWDALQDKGYIYGGPSPVLWPKRRHGVNPADMGL